jgi:hypothetical protein
MMEVRIANRGSRNRNQGRRPSRRFLFFQSALHTSHSTLERFVWRLVVIFAALAALSLDARPAGGAMPEWLDTVPPQAEIMPTRVYHSSVFMITLSANERARFWVGINSRQNMSEYLKPITIVRDTAITVFYYGEDDYGNRSKVDSMRYVLDTRPPQLRFIPEPGTYEKGVVVYFATDKPCRFEYLKDPTITKGKAVAESLSVNGVFEGYIAATDSAGNRVVSDYLKYVVDTSVIQVSVQPAGGLFKSQPTVTFDAPKPVKVFYTFDPIAPQDMFAEYTGTVHVPHGISVLRFYGKNSAGRMSRIERERFILDTIPPKIHLQVIDGKETDGITLAIKEPGIIRFTLDGTVPNEMSARYKGPLSVRHKGLARLKAYAWDDAGNQSELLEWEKKYDFTQPLVMLSPAGGTYTKPFTATISSDKKTSIYYTLDGSKPGEAALLYNQSGIAISREGTTTIRYIGIDEAGNRSDEREATYTLDSKPPQVKVRIEGSLLQKNFQVRLIADEPATIYYEVDGRNPTLASPVFTAPIPLQSGQTLSYRAKDSAGNMSHIYVMDELRKPMASPSPEAGMYSRRIAIKFVTNVEGVVYWRMAPDTVFIPFRDSIPLKEEGSHTLEYFMESREGLKSPLRRSEYYTDWTPPRVNISIKKGLLDSVSIFFECSENATIYYTTDGSNPLYSPKAFSAGNKFTLSKDRISVPRLSETKLAFYAEDAAGNQSALTVLDVFKPRVIPNVPAGRDRLYDRILSVSLNSYDQSNIYFCRHGRLPTTDSTVFTAPITLIASDTIVAFAVDVSGFKGEPDTFVYLIDLPPSAHFTMNPDTVYAGQRVIFDASTSVDKESPLSRLTFRWDFDGDGTFDTDPLPSPRISFTYAKPGAYEPRLEAIDERKRTGILSRSIEVFDRCPNGMVSVADDTGRSFCIDRYEWPNIAGKVPTTKVSWVEAKVACIDAGKRLCTRREWEAVCRRGSRSVYPYGDTYDPAQCRTEEKSLGKSGTAKRCTNKGVSDMVGNVWEWIEDKQGDYPYMMGGSFHNGKDAHCGLAIPETIAARNDDTGFRCCK